jgi:CBS domain-containing protein
VEVADVMTRASITESPRESIKEAAARMWSQQTGSVLVMESEQLLGIVTERDVLQAVAQGVDVDTTPVRSIMTTQVMTVAPDTPLHEAARQMAAGWIRHLPVVEGDRVVGMVSQRDLVGVFASLRSDPEADQLATDDLVRERRLARIEHGDLD